MSKKYFIHESSIVATDDIGDDTRVWAFCNILKGAKIGTDCNICDHCSIEGKVIIGNRVTVKNAVSLWNGVVVEDDVFIGPNAVFTNDIYPRSKVYHKEVDTILIKQGATIGANAVIVAGNTIGKYAFIGAGAVVTKDIPDYSIWYGNPAKFEWFVCMCGKRLSKSDTKTLSCECGLHYSHINGIVKPV